MCEQPPLSIFKMEGRECEHCKVVACTEEVLKQLTLGVFYAVLKLHVIIIIVIITVI